MNTSSVATFSAQASAAFVKDQASVKVALTAQRAARDQGEAAVQLLQAAAKLAEQTTAQAIAVTSPSPRGGLDVTA